MVVRTSSTELGRRRARCRPGTRACPPPRGDGRCAAGRAWWWCRRRSCRLLIGCAERLRCGPERERSPDRCAAMVPNLGGPRRHDRTRRFVVFRTCSNTWTCEFFRSTIRGPHGGGRPGYVWRNYESTPIRLSTPRCPHLDRIGRLLDRGRRPRSPRGARAHSRRDRRRRVVDRARPARLARGLVRRTPARARRSRGHRGAHRR